MAEKKTAKKPTSKPKKKTEKKRQKTPLYGMSEKQLRELDRKIEWD